MKYVTAHSGHLSAIHQHQHPPQIGSTTIADSFTPSPGGKGANEAVAVSRLGVPCYLVGRVGNDDFGHLLKYRLSGHGVLTEYVEEDMKESTGVAMIITAKVCECPQISVLGFLF